jgi:small subunit ribosomal protein S6
MTREYELVYIFDSALEEAQVNEHLERFHALLKAPESPEPVTAAAHWGRRTLAYPIRGKEVGYYVVVRFETDPTLLPEMERLIKLDETVLRYLLVVNEGLAPVSVPSPEGETPETKRDDDDSDEENDE